MSNSSKAEFITNYRNFQVVNTSGQEESHEISEIPVAHTTSVASKELP